MNQYSEYLKSIWKDQLFNDHPITIPLYSGNGLNHNEFNEKDVFSGMYLIKNELNDHIIKTFNDLASKYKVDDYKLIINEIKFDDYDDHLDSYVKVIVDYKIMKDDLIIDKRVDTLLCYPKVNYNYQFKINGNYYTLIDELVNNYSLVYKNYNKNDDSFEEININLANGNNLKFIKYFEGSKYLAFRKYNKTINTITYDDLTDAHFDELSGYDLTSKIDVLSYFIDDVDLSNKSSLELVQFIFDNFDNRKYFQEDNIKSKRIFSGYNYLKELTTESIKFIIFCSNKLGKTKLIKVKYKNVLSKIYASKILNYVGDINPITFLSSSRKINLMGVHGAKKSSLDMRDYHESYVGFIDPLETPESGKLGLLVHRAIGSGYDKSGKLYKVDGINEDYKSLNFSALTIPFIHNNDSIRDSMATSHAKQGLLLLNNEVPFVSTGCDRVLNEFLNKNIVAPIDGVVKILDKNLLEITNDNGSVLVRSPTPYLGNDKTMIHYTFRVKDGDYVKKGYQLLNNNSYKDGYMTLGREVLMAWMPYKGLNYEDSAVISESLANNLTTLKGYRLSYTTANKSISEELIPELGSEVKADDYILKYKSINKKALLLDLYDEDYKYIKYSKGGIVTDIELLDSNNKPVDSDWDKVIITISTPHKVKVGDKFSFSSAGKCVISTILPDSEMPKTQDGKVIDIIYNTLGIPSRMNLSQLFEASLGMLNKLIKDELLHDPTKESIIELLTKINSEFNYDNLNSLIEFIHDLNGDDLIKFINNFKNGFVFEVKQFDRSITLDKISSLFTKLGFDNIYNPNNGERLYLPHENKLTKFPVFYGYMRILALKHLVDEKLSSTSIKGLSDCREKSQKVGEMEHLALEAHNCMNFINELSLIRSNSKLRSKLIKDISASNDPNRLLDINKYKKINPHYDEFKKVFRAMGLRIVTIKD